MAQKNLHIFIFITAITVAISYPTGAPVIACEKMVPHHPPTTTFGTPPFAVDISDLYYLPGSVITGTLRSTNGSLFRGFLIEARLADNSSTVPYGEFIDVDSTLAHTVCGQDNTQGLTHNNNTDKTNVNFTWSAPPSANGDIHFKVTIVQSYHPVSRYWLNIFSPTLLDCSLHPTEGQCSILTHEPDTGPTTQPYTGTTQTTQPTTTPASGLIPFDKECGYTKGCFPACEGGCKYLTTWHAHDDVIDFQLQMKLDGTDNIWMAVGISPDAKMDGTSVMACLSSNAKISMDSSYNVGTTNRVFPNKTMGLNHPSGSIADGVFTCKWTRAMKIEGQNLFADLDNEYYILIGNGPVSGGIKQQHFHIPPGSSTKVNFLKDDIVGQSKSAKTLVKIHGSLMVIAWVFLSSVGTVASRHCKKMLESRLFFKVKLWFQFHRPVMILAVACVIVAFVVIFIEVKGFSEISPSPGKEYTKAHPYMGIVVTALAIINPIMAIFRPAPDHKQRYIFNWAHFLVGTSCHILAVATVYFGLDLDVAKVDKSARYIMIIYTAIFVIVQIVFEIYRRCKADTASVYAKLEDTPQDAVDSYPSNNLKTKIQADVSMSQSHQTRNSSYVGGKTKTKDDDDHVLLYMLIAHMLLMSVVAGLVVGSICSPTTFHKWFS